MLVDGLNAKFVAVGEDFRFGNRARGSAETLTELGGRYGFDVAIVPILREHGVEIRSTAIREAIAAGEVERAANLLGRPYLIRGVVVPGEGRGATIGVPTANISFPNRLAVPQRGVYAVFAEIDDTTLPAVANFGVRPTFAGIGDSGTTHITGSIPPGEFGGAPGEPQPSPRYDAPRPPRPPGPR